VAAIAIGKRRPTEFGTEREKEEEMWAMMMNLAE
jgi:hypothetical protein